MKTKRGSVLYDINLHFVVNIHYSEDNRCMCKIMINQVFLQTVLDKRRKTQAADPGLQGSTDSFLPLAEYTQLLAYMELWALS